MIILNKKKLIMYNILFILSIILGFTSIVGIILLIYEIKRAPLLPPDVDF